MREYAIDVSFKAVVRINADNPVAAKEEFLKFQAESLESLAKAPFKVTEISADDVSPYGPFEIDGAHVELNGWDNSANDDVLDLCDECGNDIPVIKDGSIVNKHHKESCSLHDENQD